MSALVDTLSLLAGVLDRKGLQWYVFGAQAVAIRGAPRATQDLDVTVFVARSDVPQLLADLQAVGLVHRYPGQEADLVDAGAVLPLGHASGMEVDLVIGDSGLERLALQRAERIDVGGVLAPVAHATDLLVMKILAGRGKDLDDARALLAGAEVDIVEARDLLSQLEEALGQSDLIPALESALLDLGDGHG